MERQETTNTFTGGLISDLNPISTPSTVLTDVKNGTLLTFNGNEMVMQNDMGNAKIANAKLSDGFIPIGVKEDAGILYIVSHNKVTNETEIGSFPSPAETSDESYILTGDIQLDSNGSNLNKNIQISSKKLNCGDSFLIFLKDSSGDDGNSLTSLISSFDETDRKFYKIKLISIENGVENDLTNTLINQYKLINGSFVEQKYWFVPISESDIIPSTFEYVKNKMFQRYKSRKSGKLYLKLITEDIDEFYINNNSRYPELTIGDEGTDYYLRFSFYIKALSLLRPDKIEIKLTIVDLDGLLDDVTTTTTINVNMTSNTEYYTPSNLLPMINIGNSCNKVASYTIKCYNSNYDISFDNFIITDVIDLSIDPLQWSGSKNADYNFYDYNLFDYKTL